MSAVDSSIREHRTAEITLTLTQASGAPVAGQEVQVQQLRHKFLFGANWGDCTLAYVNGELEGTAITDAERRNEAFLRLFNQATLPFYWERFERERGKPDTERLRTLAQWYVAHGCAVKGHPLCWHTHAAPWLLDLSPEQILKEQLARIERDVTAFGDLIDQWDVINEAVIMPIFDRYDNGITRLCKWMGRIELIRTLFEAARAANPNATLLLNDFDVSPAFDILVEGCLAAGVRIDMIGIQSHMHQGYWGVERTQRVLEAFERFQLPIAFTETTLISGELMPPEITDLNDYQVEEWLSTPEGEQRQTEEVILHYKTLLAHPAVQAITWWDITDGHWLKAPSGLLRHDQTPKPAYEALLKLIKGEWWLPPTSMVTDAQGRICFNGFLGDYELRVGSQTLTFAVAEKGSTALTLML